MSTRRTVAAALLDVDVLLALGWPNHEGHAVAPEWFERESRHGWAITPITEAGFARVSSNRSALPTATTLQRAVELLGQLIKLRGHAFWGDTVPLVTGAHLALQGLRGHRQVTDAHLLALCLANGGRLVTFDHGLQSLVPANPSLVEVLHP